MIVDMHSHVLANVDDGSSSLAESVAMLRLEAQQKLSEMKPLSVGQASRISGVSPADINVLLIYLEKKRRQS